MPRNGAGVFTLEEPPFVSQTPISSTAMNSDLADVADAITGSVARDGQGGMTAAIKLAQTGFNYGVDPNTGMSRSGADTQVITCGGTDVVEIETTGVNITGILDATEIKRGGVAILPVGLGPLPWSGLTAPPLWILAYGQTLLRASYPALWTFAQAEIAAGNTLYTNGDGSTTFTVPDMRGRVAPGKDDMGGVAANRLTAPFYGTAATVLGAPGGVQNQPLTTALIPNLTSNRNQNIVVNSNASNVVVSSGISDWQNGNGGNLQAFNQGSVSAGQIQSQGNNVITVDTINTGGSAPTHANVQPSLITNHIIYAGA